MLEQFLINVKEILELQVQWFLCLIIRVILKKEDISIDMEELELELIDFDVEEVFDDEEGIIIYAPFEQFGAIQSFFEKENVEIISRF